MVIFDVKDLNKPFTRNRTHRLEKKTLQENFRIEYTHQYETNTLFNSFGI